MRPRKRSITRSTTPRRSTMSMIVSVLIPFPRRDDDDDDEDDDAPDRRGRDSSRSFDVLCCVAMTTILRGSSVQAERRNPECRKLPRCLVILVVPNIFSRGVLRMPKFPHYSSLLML